MNNGKLTKEYLTDEEIITSLKKGKSIEAPKAFFQDVLNKLPNISPEKKVRSPYASLALYFSNHRRNIFASMIVLVLFTTSGVVYKLNQNNNSANQTPAVAFDNTTISPNDTSDKALNQDLGVIDAQLNELNSDSGKTDNSLSM